jgi:hypothetical protein
MSFMKGDEEEKHGGGKRWRGPRFCLLGHLEEASRGEHTLFLELGGPK